MPIGQRQVAERHAEPELAQPPSEAYLRLMGRPVPETLRPALTLDEPHILVDTDAGPSAGVLLELDGERARVIYAWDDEAGSQGRIETRLPAEYVQLLSRGWTSS